MGDKSDNNKNKKEWLKMEVEELINIYHSKTELWDVASKTYKDRVKKQTDLKELAEQFNTTPEEIQRKIHNLRNQFNSEFKKTRATKSGQGTDELYISKWPYYNLLLFLQGGAACKPAIGNIPVDGAVEEAGNETQWEQSEEVNLLEDTPSVVEKNDIIPKKKKKIEVSKHDLMMQKAIRTLNEEEDQYDVFGKYIASEMRNLSSEYLRKKLKRKFQQVLLENNEEDEVLLSPSHSYSNPSSVSSARGYFDSQSNPEQYITLQQQPPNLASYLQTETESTLPPNTILHQLP